MTDTLIFAPVVRQIMPQHQEYRNSRQGYRMWHGYRFGDPFSGGNPPDTTAAEKVDRPQVLCYQYQRLALRRRKCLRKKGVGRELSDCVGNHTVAKVCDAG